jgi:hypothetical protein
MINRKITTALKRIPAILVLLAIGTMLVASPVFAIAQPDSMSIPYAKVYYDVIEAGDMFFVAECRVTYAVEPTDYNADEAFLFEVWNTTATALIASCAINDYGDRPIGIYKTAAEVTALGIAVGDALNYTIDENPIITFGAPMGALSFVTLSASSYVDQDLGNDGEVPSANNIRNGMIRIAENMENTDSPTAPYIIMVEGYKYLTIAGGNLFLEGMPGLNVVCPILFQSGSEVMEGDTPESTGTYASTLTIQNKWGTTVANGLTQFGVFLGINQELAGSLLLFILGIAFAVFIYQKTESGVVVLLIVATLPFIGAYLGLLSLALAFILVIFIVTLLGYFFFSRGAL